ncbi:cupin domain-containing protein [Acinetobacter radioresistens]|uniref:cupin domain-containing protein n=1 Tax=Acinetobacter radioresistens TaxID=40216 RepID=UPI0032146530
MWINADFSQVAMVRPNDYQWVKSPGGEVERVMLDRIGGETARATSLVRYAPQSIFPEHQHPLGEEILVLSGTFTENGNQHYPAGWYLRNPDGSKHTPSSEEGTLIFVKLMQMTREDVLSLRINTHEPENWQTLNQRKICPLYHSQDEQTYLEKLIPHQNFAEHSANGIELLVVQGELLANGETYPAGSWIRLPIQSSHNFHACSAGAILYVKTGHLLSAQKFIEQKP